MVKIDTVAFGVLMARIATYNGEIYTYNGEIYADSVAIIHEMVKNCFPEPTSQHQLPDTTVLNQLIAAIQTGNKIEAIKAYRTLSGYGLKDAKDAVERYWPQPQPQPNAFTREQLFKRLNESRLPGHIDNAIYNFIAALPTQGGTLGDILSSAAKHS